MWVYLQVSKKGTEFDPLKIRAKQAAPGYHREFEAMMAFHRKKSTITPALLAYGKRMSISFMPNAKEMC